ncbi:MAG: GAF domain-containing protein [Candidatus Krumholzibacteria bacterium]|nr:GAF domain-containing protein [Candidatus Krumholzibacteria bacterium]
MNWFLLAIAGVITGFGLLIVVPPLVNARLANHWSWATPQMLLIVLLTLAMLALVGLAHQQRYVEIIRSRFERSRVEEMTRARMNTARLYALLDVSHLMGASEGLESVFDHITEICADVFRCDLVSLMTFNEHNNVLIVRAVSGRSMDHTMLGAQQKMGQGIAGWAGERCEPLLLGQGCNLADYPGLQLHSTAVAAAMVVPIILSGSLVGVINVSSRSWDVDYDQEDFRALQVFAETAGACIRQAQRCAGMTQQIRRLEATIRTSDTQAAGHIAEIMGTNDDI